ncbi:MAG: hypothetical protein EA397_02855 [Deltaproteobacteria bacterium]|nr:MAG: hypothetical protein EA397_02855 [Deltaproteobacteria bacterium]
MSGRQIARARGTPQEVRERLNARLMVVGNLWLPTRRELHDWHDAPAPLYLSWSRGDVFEIGPRLETMPAARLAPVYRGRLIADGSDHTRLVASLRWPLFTLTVLGLLWIMLAGWGVATLTSYSQGTTHLGWVGAWGVSSLIATVGPALGWWYGAAELSQEQPWLEQALSQAPLPDEDW